MKSSIILPTLSLLLLALLNSGCAPLISATSFTALKFPWSDAEDKPQVPHKMTSVWTHTVLNQMGKRGVRGFGGRIMFYQSDKDESVMVDGTLTVYAFDESNKHRQTTNPDRKFVFLSEKLKDHYSKSNIGHSYSIWIPWDEVGGEQKQISLITRFEPKEGTAIMSENTRKLLPGITKEATEENQVTKTSNGLLKNFKGKVELLSHEEESKPVTSDPIEKKTKSFTIEVPSDFVSSYPVQNQSKEEETGFQLASRKQLEQYDSYPDPLNQESSEEKSQTKSGNEISDHFEQKVHSLQNQLQAQKRQGNQPSSSHAPTKRFHGWSPEPRPSVTERFRSWQAQIPKNSNDLPPKTY